MAVIVILLIVVLIVNHNTKATTENNLPNELKQKPLEMSSNHQGPKTIGGFRFRNWWERATREECKQMLISALVWTNPCVFSKKEDLSGYDIYERRGILFSSSYDIQDRMMVLLTSLDDDQIRLIYPDSRKLLFYLEGLTSKDESLEMFSCFKKKYNDNDLVEWNKFDYVMGISWFDGTMESPNNSKLKDILYQMIKNYHTRDLWKNIPLAKDAIRIMNDEGVEFGNEIYKQFCEMVVVVPLLNVTDTPRLVLSYINLYHFLDGSSERWAGKENKIRKVIDTNTSYDEIIRLIKEDQDLLYDPIQFSEKWENNIYEVEKECDEKLKDVTRRMGFCHLYWSTKTQVLAEHGITWRSPAVMNPKVRFD